MKFNMKTLLTYALIGGGAYYIYQRYFSQPQSRMQLIAQGQAIPMTMATERQYERSIGPGMSGEEEGEYYNY